MKHAKQMRQDVGRSFRASLTTLTFVALCVAQPALAAPTYQAGTIDDISSDADGVVFRYADRSLPTNCTGAIGSFFRIDKADQAMSSVLLSFFMSGKRNAVTFTSGLTPAGYCRVSAFDPVE